MKIPHASTRWGQPTARVIKSLKVSMVACAGAAAFSVAAQTLPPPSPSAPPPPPPPATAPLPTRSVSASTLGGPNLAAPEQALERLFQQLQLSPEQQRLWQRYVRELDAATGMMMRERPVGASGGPAGEETATQQLARVALVLQNRLAAMEAIERAARELHAVLNPEQQKVADLGLLATLPPLLAAAPVAAPFSPREDGRGRGEGSMRQRRGGVGGGMGGGIGGGMRP